MNKIDRQWYNHLKALSTIPRNDPFDKYRTENTKKIKEYMEGTTWNELHALGYVNSSPHVKQIITPSGLEQLRMLEDMRRKELTLIVSIVAIIISIFAFTKSMSWI